MRIRLVTLLILLMVAFPVWSASTVCCHLQKMQQHPCCEHMQMSKQHCDHASTTLSDHAAKAGTCHCDQFQHSQFGLSLPQIPVVQPTTHFAPEMTIPTPLAERHETIIRPPIV